MTEEETVRESTRRGWSYHRVVENPSLFFSHPGPIGQGLYFTPVVKASFLGEHSKSNSKWLRHHF